MNTTHRKSTDMDLTLDNIADYARRFARRPHAILADLEADAAARRVPIVGPWEAQILSLLARSIQAQRLLELGTATGYSAIWLAHAVADWDGHITTVDQDATRVREAQQHIDDAGLQRPHPHRARHGPARSASARWSVRLHF